MNRDVETEIELDLLCGQLRIDDISYSLLFVLSLGMAWNLYGSGSSYQTSPPQRSVIQGR